MISDYASELTTGGVALGAVLLLIAVRVPIAMALFLVCLLYTSDAADE